MIPEEPFRNWGNGDSPNCREPGQVTAWGTGRPVQVCTQGDVCPGALGFNSRASRDGPRASSSVVQVSEPETVAAAPLSAGVCPSLDPEPKGVQTGLDSVAPKDSAQGVLVQDGCERLFDNSFFPASVFLLIRET